MLITCARSRPPVRSPPRNIPAAAASPHISPHHLSLRSPSSAATPAPAISSIQPAPFRSLSANSTSTRRKRWLKRGDCLAEPQTFETCHSEPYAKNPRISSFGATPAPAQILPANFPLPPRDTSPSTECRRSDAPRSPVPRALTQSAPPSCPPQLLHPAAPSPQQNTASAPRAAKPRQVSPQQSSHRQSAPRPPAPLSRSPAHSLCPPCGYSCDTRQTCAAA